ncbi:MAG: transmembrane 220 family protein [Bacteroidota bacterium]
MKVFNIIFILVFILFAAVQYNDPDPYLWMPIYLYPAVLCNLAINNKYPKIGYYIGFTIFGVYALYKMFDENGVIDWIRYHQATSIASTMKAEQPWVEETREFFGLIIILVVLAINFIKGNKSISKK